MKRAILFGATEFARIFFILYSKTYEQMGMPQPEAFIVDPLYLQTKEFCGMPVYSFDVIKTRFPPDSYVVFVLIGYRKMNSARADVYNRLKSLDYEMPNYIHPHAGFFGDAMGDGNVMFPGAIVDTGTTIGNGNILRSGALLGHDSVLGDFNFFAYHACITGSVKVGSYCTFGLNCTTTPRLVIADRTVVGAGALLTENTEEGAAVLPYHKDTILKGKSHLVEF